MSVIIIHLLLLYLATLVVVILHEFGHFPEKFKLGKDGIHINRLFPIPEACAMRARSQYGGLVMNFIILYIVYYFKPELLFLQLVGLVSFLHFILYVIFGSFNKELNESYIRKHPSILRWWVFDDVPNKYAVFFVSIGIITFVMFQGYYVPILLNLFI